MDYNTYYSVKKLLHKLIIFSCLIILIIYICNNIIKIKSSPYISYNYSDLPNKKVGVVLGTSKNLKNGYKNLYFYNRIDAAEELYKNSKIKYIIVSGDNSKKSYNEPEDMKQELIKRGIPEDHIYEDFAGFRTLDSVIRVKEIFGQNSFIIISQKFHNERAIYISLQNDISAYGYNAKDVGIYNGLKTNIREYFARVKVFIDIIIKKKPKFGGNKIIIEDN